MNRIAHELPLELWGDILTYLNPLESLRFKRACKDHLIRSAELSLPLTQTEWTVFPFDRCQTPSRWAIISREVCKFMKGRRSPFEFLQQIPARQRAFLNQVQFAPLNEVVYSPQQWAHLATLLPNLEEVHYDRYDLIDSKQSPDIDFSRFSKLKAFYLDNQRIR
jgi:hypothetical protein